MARAKVAITIDYELVKRLDDLVVQERVASRSRAIEDAVRDALARLDRTRLARECSRLAPADEQELADEGLAADLREWPEY
jgi:metal-responsive CopG/Arc/MetJ family transcriptional regulator